ncbi:MAG TPA: polysaccharide pyruvyl transferase family protein, partial [Flavipsychrobacter sp.]|nr:polysaccharide pyruvyl transferase family protein [Flavipsychrobacter sp.]
MIYHVFANRSNIGDWLSAKGIQKLTGEVEITECLCDEPFVEETIKTLSVAGENDLVIIGGGGLLMDYFLPFWKAFLPIAERVPFVILGIGYCDIKHEPSLPPKDIVEEVISKAALCIVRDKLSQTYLQHLELPEPVPCPSIYAIPATALAGRDILQVNNYTTCGAEAYETMRAAGQKYAADKGITFRETNNRIEQGSEEQLAHLLSLYARSEIIISSALHGCIIGVAMGRTVLAVSGDRKIESFMEAVGMQDQVIDASMCSIFEERLFNLQDGRPDMSVVDEIREKNIGIAELLRKKFSHLMGKAALGPFL